MTRQTVLLLPALVLLLGCGGQDDRGAHQAGQGVGETVIDFAKGVGKGVDNRLKLSVELNEEVANLGLQATVAKDSGFDDEGCKTVAVYFIASRPVTACLRAKALNSDGDEIGRATIDIELTADDAKYVTFAFDSEMDTQLVAKYVVEVGTAKPKESKPPANDPPVGDFGKEV